MFKDLQEKMETGVFKDMGLMDQDDAIKISFAKKVLAEYANQEEATVMEAKLALCVTHLLEVIDQ